MSDGRIKHGYLKYGIKPKIYVVWEGMIQRVTNPNSSRYSDYGGRGITICNEWKNAATFIAWAFNNGYNELLKLDRKDNNKGYYPENCHFVTPSKSSINRRKRANFGIQKIHNSFAVHVRRNNKLYYGGCSTDINIAKVLRNRLVNKLDNIN